jgi:hypothetical protein
MADPVQPPIVVAPPADNAVATHASVQASTDAQTSWLTLMGWIRVGATVIGIVLAMAGYDVVKRPTPLPAPDGIQQIIDLLKTQAAKPAPPVINVQPPAPAVVTPQTQQPEWNAENVGKWLEKQKDGKK